jgi:hypothetical protein
MKSWQTFLKEQQSKDLEQEGFTLFFKKNGKYYAVKESSRIIFAKNLLFLKKISKKRLLTSYTICYQIFF